MHLDSADPILLPVALRRELLAGGHTDRSLAMLLRTGALERPRRGAYVDGATWRSMSAEQQYGVRCHAAYRNAKADVVLSHSSALPFWVAPTWGQGLGDVHLTRLDAASGRREAGVRQHRGAVQEGDMTTVHGLRVMTPLRATLEVATTSSLEAAVIVANHFLHRGDFTAGDLEQRFDAPMDRWPGSLKTRVVLHLADARIESVGESRTLVFFWRNGLPIPVPQFEVYDGAVLIARLDFAWPELGIWFEFDGRVKYERHLRDGESPVDVVLREKARQDRVAELTGWRCVRITWSDLADPARLAARVRSVIASAARSPKR